MIFYRHLLLPAVCLFCLTCLVACKNYESANQLTVVQGTVTSYETGRPLPGVLMATVSFENGFSGRIGEALSGDSARTDAQGHYQFSFRNKKSQFYAIALAPHLDPPYPPRRLAFVANQPVSDFAGSGGLSVEIGRTNTVDFKPNELRTVAVRIHNRNTGYQRLEFGHGVLHGNNLDTLAYFTDFYLTTQVAKFRYYNLNAAGYIGKDTAVALVVQNPTALPPDTLRATLTFVR